MSFSERLASARKAKGLSQEALAEALGISRQAVSKWETGESKPDLDNLIALCEKLELNIEYLCFGKREMTQTEPPERKKHGEKGWQIIAVAVVAIMCLTIGGFAGNFITGQQETLPAADQQWGQQEQRNEPTEPDYNALLAPVKVINVRFSHDFESGDHKIFVMSNAVPDGMELNLLIENVDSLDAASITKTCTFDGDYFTATLGGSIIRGMEYRITGIFVLGDAQIRIPLVLYSIDREFNSYSYIRLWEE